MNHSAANSRSPALSHRSKRSLRLDQAKNDLLTFARSIDVPGVPLSPDDEACERFHPVEARFGKHHLVWLDCLQRVEDGEIKRLMGLMPPGSAKSTYTSILFPVHVMGRFAGSQVIVASYGAELPRKWGRKARSIVRQKIFSQIFRTALSKESAAADEWALANGSEYMGAGVLTGITGNRADGVVWDDLIKGRDQADSQVMRQKTWDAYFDDLLTRKKPNAWEIGITTRWHEDDIAGRILPEGYAGESGWIAGRDGNRWYVVCIPAEAERADDVLGRKAGERIWPEWFTPDHFTPFKRNPRTWSALYQQRPAPEQGDYFKAEWLRAVEKVPPREHLRIYGGSDYAVTADGGDYTVHVVVGLDAEGRMYLLDLWRRRAAADEWVEALLRSRARMEADRLGGRAGADQVRRRPLPGQAHARALRVRRAPAVRRARRQGGARAIDARPHGAGGAVRSGKQPLARRLPRRVAELPCRPPRRPGRRDRPCRPAARHDGEAGEAEAGGAARARPLGQRTRKRELENGVSPGSSGPLTGHKRTSHVNASRSGNDRKQTCSSAVARLLCKRAKWLAGWIVGDAQVRGTV